MRIFRRLLCVLLCLCLMAPCLAAAEGDVNGIQFDLQFQMDPLAFPAENRKVLTGLADLINITSLQGTLATAYNGCFDMNAALMLAGQGDTRATLRVYGTESHWAVESSLLGSEKMMINMIATLEFALKAYYHLDIPVQRVALFVSPYVHTSAFEAFLSAWRGVMNTQEGPRVIAREDLLALAEELSAIAGDDRTFRVWTQAIALEAGYDEAIMEAMTTLPEWLESFVDDTGIQITVSGATETWRTGDTTLFIRTVEENMNAWSITLPATVYGYTLSAFCKSQSGGQHNLEVTITDEYDDTLLHASLQAEGLPAELPVSAPFTLDVDMDGSIFEEPLQLRLAGEGAEGYLSLSLLNSHTNQPQLTVSGTLQPYAPETIPEFSTAQLLEGFNLLSINDEGLTQLVGSVASPLLKGAFPLLVHMPASSVQSILDLLTESGLLDFVVNGGSAMEEEFFD